MSKHGVVRDLAEWIVAWPILQSLGKLPLPAARLEARWLAAAFRWAAPGLRRVALRNLTLAMPEDQAARREAILQGMYDSLARSLLVFSRFPRLTAGNIGEWIRYEGFQHFEQARAGGKGVLFLTAHLGNWELSALSHGFFGHPLHILVRRLDNPYLDRLVWRYRSLSGNRIIEKNDSPRSLLEALRGNQAVGMLIDQNAAPDNGVFVNFFGVEACASTGLARIARRTGAAVIPGFALWEESEKRYVLRFWPPVEMAVSADEESDVGMNTQRIQAVLEKIIRRHPEQWLWIHRRWKTRPQGEEPIY